MKNTLWQSQNFLHDSKLVGELIDNSNICKNDIVIEIGPGRGIITWQLVKKCRKVYGIEFDFCLYEYLRHKFNDCSNINIINNDFVKFILPRKAPYKVFSSIPFNITSAVFKKLFFTTNPPHDAYLVVQKETAEKYAGRPYTHECLCSLLMKPFYEMKIIHYFKKTDFMPVPDVSAVLLYVKKRLHPLVQRHNSKKYCDFICYTFAHDGQTLKDRLRHIFTGTQYTRLAARLGIMPGCGILETEAYQWLALFGYFSENVSNLKQRLVLGSYALHEKLQNNIVKIHKNTRRR